MLMRCFNSVLLCGQISNMVWIYSRFDPFINRKPHSLFFFDCFWPGQQANACTEAQAVRWVVDTHSYHTYHHLRWKHINSALVQGSSSLSTNLCIAMQPGTAVQGKSLEALATKPEQNTTHAGQQHTAGNRQLPASHQGRLNYGRSTIHFTPKQPIAWDLRESMERRGWQKFPPGRLPEPP